MQKDSFDMWDKAEVRKIADSQEGKAFLNLINKDGDSKLQEALLDAQNGNIENAKTIVQRYLASSEAEALMKRIRGEL